MPWGLFSQIIILLIVLVILALIIIDSFLNKRVEAIKEEHKLLETQVLLKEYDRSLWEANNPGQQLITWPQRRF